MTEVMDSLDKNNTWDLVELQVGRKPIGIIWIFKKKLNAKYKAEKYKSHLLAKGYSPVEGIDCGDIFCLAAKLTSIRFIFSNVVSFYLEVE